MSTSRPAFLVRIGWDSSRAVNVLSGFANTE